MTKRVTERKFLKDILLDVRDELYNRDKKILSGTEWKGATVELLTMLKNSIEIILDQPNTIEIAKDIINSYRGWRNVMNQWKRDKPWPLDRYMNYHTSKRFGDSPEPYNLESWKEEIKKAKEILKVKK